MMEIYKIDAIFSGLSSPKNLPTIEAPSGDLKQNLSWKHIMIEAHIQKDIGIARGA